MLGGSLPLLAKPASSFRVVMHFTSLLVIMLELDSDGEKNSFRCEISPSSYISVLISDQKNWAGEGNKCSQLGLNVHTESFISQ